MKKYLKVIVVYAIIALMLEGLVRLTDPWGYYDFRAFGEWWNSARIEHPTGYRHIEGQYIVAGNQITINADGLRHVPSQGDCLVALIGDSVTFGHGVSDEETFAWHIAQAVDARIINSGLSGYNADNLALVPEYLPQADLYVYFMVNNDPGNAMTHAQISVTENVVGSLVFHYLRYLLYVVNADAGDDYTPQSITRFQAMLDAMPDNTLFVAQNEALATIAENHIDQAVVRLPGEDERISLFNPHMNPTGNQMVASALIPLIEAALADHTCSAGEDF